MKEKTYEVINKMISDTSEAPKGKDIFEEN